MKIERPVLSWDGVDHSQILVWIILVWALVGVFFPRFCWWWEWWEFRDKPEPSELRLWVTRIGGVLIAAVMIWMLQNPGPLEISLSTAGR
jgi:hypothetical protein